MKIVFDREANAINIQFKNGRVVRDIDVAANVFAGFSRDNELIEIQIVDFLEQDDAWITAEAAAKLLKKSERTVLRWIQQGKIKAKKVGREHRISLEEISKLAS